MEDNKKYGMIFNIQKFSINDGPGIRTAVFFVGFPLTCKWCTNPESQEKNFQILWDEKMSPLRNVRDNLPEYVG